MSSNPSSDQTSPTVSGRGATRSGVSPEAAFADRDIDRDRLNENLSKLRRDVAGVKDVLTRLAAQKGDEVAKTVRNVSQAVASHVGGAASGVADAGSELASSAKDQAKTFAAELESLTRRNPLGTIAGALFIGVVIGIMARGRS